MDDVFNEMWDQFVKEGFDQPESMKESCYCIAKRYHELMGGMASPLHNLVIFSIFSAAKWPERI